VHAYSEVVSVGIDGMVKRISVVLQAVLHIHPMERTTTLGIFLLSFIMMLYAMQFEVEFLRL
jgi:hypothetical protein